MIATQQHDVVAGVFTGVWWCAGRYGPHRGQLQRYPGCGDQLLQMQRQLVVAHLAAWQQGETERGARFEQGRQLLQQGDEGGRVAIKRAT